MEFQTLVGFNGIAMIIGGGGREAALAEYFSRHPKVKKIFVAPGNGWIGQLPKVELVLIKANEIEKLRYFAQDNQVGLTIVGPEQPLVLGIVDLFEAAGLKIFGPSKAAAELEGSKVKAKLRMRRWEVPTARFEIFNDPNDAINFIKEVGAPIVIKADGLAEGKGAIVCMTIEEALAAIDLIMVQKKFGAAGDQIVIEEYLEGEEASVLLFADGTHGILLPESQDHKPVFESKKDRELYLATGGDPNYKEKAVGKNTGGMGAYTPAPVYSQDVNTQVNEISCKIIAGMAKEGIPYKGILYIGIIVDKAGRVKVIEFNCRFGDPEIQPILLRVKSDLLEIMYRIASGQSIQGMELEIDPQVTVGIVLSSGGYPDAYAKGKQIFGLEKVAKLPGIHIVCAGVKYDGGKWFTDGGRVLIVMAKADTFEEAIPMANEAAEMITWEGRYRRSDIAWRAVRR